MNTPSKEQCCEQCRHSVPTVSANPTHTRMSYIDICHNPSCECHKVFTKENLTKAAHESNKIQHEDYKEWNKRDRILPPDHWEVKFDEYVNEVRRDTHWGKERDAPIYYFGFKTQRADELFTVTDFGNIKSFIRSLLQKQRETQDFKFVEYQKPITLHCSCENPKPHYHEPSCILTVKNNSYSSGYNAGQIKGRAEVKKELEEKVRGKIKGEVGKDDKIWAKDMVDSGYNTALSDLLSLITNL